jgi:peroxiredoxin
MSDWLPRDLRLIRLGIVGEMRNPVFRLLGVVAALGAGAYAWNQGALAASTSVMLAAWGGRGFALAACLWFGTGALRDQNAQLGAVLRSKPVDGARWVLLTWATGIGLWLILLAAMFLGAMAGQLRWSGLAAIGAHGLGFARAALVMIPLGTLGFSLSRLTRSPLGASVIVLAFLCVLAGLQLIPQFLRPDYTQNLGLYLATAALLLVVTAFLAERFRRGELRRPALPVLGVLGCAALAVGAGNQARQAAMPPEDGSVADMMSVQYLQPGRRAPGFWLPDQWGRTVRTAAYPGKILLIYVFAPDDMEAARTLPALDAMTREFGARGVQPLAVCLSPDHGDGAALAWAGGFRFPLGSDHTTVKTSSPPESALATAFAAKVLPTLVVTDRRRRARVIMSDPGYTPEQLRFLVQGRLAEEPE